MRAVRVHTNDGIFAAVLGDPGRKWTPYVCLSSYPVRKRKLSNREVEKFTAPLMRKGKDYPLKRAARQMLRVGNKYEITGGAKKLLREATR